MIKRTSREHVLKILKDNQNNWNILDIGCSVDAIEFAQTTADIQNLENFYQKKNKKFVLIHDEFTINNGMLTPTLKLKRIKIIENYKQQLENLY